MIIEALLVSTFLTYIVPEDKNGKMRYPSGIRDFDATNTYGYSASKDPVLVLPIAVYDSSYKLIPVGNYQVRLSDDEKELILIQSGNVVANLPIVRAITMPVKSPIAEAYAEMMNSTNLIIVLKKDNMKLYSIVYTGY